MAGHRTSASWLKANWDIVRTSLWPVPSVMSVAGLGLAALMLFLDGTLGPEERLRGWWMHRGDGEDARTLLSTLVGALIAMASMAFSVTVVALTLAANTFGSRLVRVFRADLLNQVVLGTFLMTILYCLPLLYEIRGRAEPDEVPHLSVTVGTLLSLLSVLALLGFIQGVAKSIVADEVVRRVGTDLEGAIAGLPDAGRNDALRGRGERDLASRRGEGELISLPREGYVQVVDYEGMRDWATDRNALLALDFRAGDFVVDGERRIRLYPPSDDPDRVRRELEPFIVSGGERTPTQDLEFAVRHLVEIAVRALSPGINDPFTAMVVVDRLRGSLTKLMAKQLPGRVVLDEAGDPRVLRDVSSFGGVMDAAFHQIRQAGASKPAVMVHLLRGIAKMADHARTAEQKAELLRHAGLMLSSGMREISEPADRDDLTRAYGLVDHACNGTVPLVPAHDPGAGPPELGEASGRPRRPGLT